MSNQAAASNALMEQQNHFTQFLTWVTPVVFLFVVLYAGTAIFFRDLASGISSGVLAGYGIALLLAWQLLRSGRFFPALYVACLGVFAVAFLIALAQPMLFPNLIMLPVLAIAIALPYLHGGALVRLLFTGWVTTVVIGVVGLWLPAMSRLPVRFITALQLGGIAAASAIGIFLFWQFHERLITLFREMQATHAALQQTYAEVEARAETQANLLAEIEHQQATIQELSVPVLPIAPRTWLLPLLGNVDQARIRQVQARTLATLHQERAQQLLVDLTGITAVTPEVADELVRFVHAVQLLGMTVILVGIRAEVAQTMTHAAVDLSGVPIARDLTVVLQRLYTETAERNVRL